MSRARYQGVAALQRVERKECISEAAHGKPKECEKTTTRQQSPSANTGRRTHAVVEVVTYAFLSLQAQSPPLHARAGLLRLVAPWQRLAVPCVVFFLALYLVKQALHVRLLLSSPYLFTYLFPIYAWTTSPQDGTTVFMSIRVYARHSSLATTLSFIMMS